MSRARSSLVAVRRSSRIAAAGALLALLAACDWITVIDPRATISESLKSWCRLQSNCTVHEEKPGKT
jgi:hypothetical protein